MPLLHNAIKSTNTQHLKCMTQLKTQTQAQACSSKLAILIYYTRVYRTNVKFLHVLKFLLQTLHLLQATVICTAFSFCAKSHTVITDCTA